MEYHFKISFSRFFSVPIRVVRNYTTALSLWLEHNIEMNSLPDEYKEEMLYIHNVLTTLSDTIDEILMLEAELQKLAYKTIGYKKFCKLCKQTQKKYELVQELYPQVYPLIKEKCMDDNLRGFFFEPLLIDHDELTDKEIKSGIYGTIHERSPNYDFVPFDVDKL